MQGAIDHKKKNFIILIFIFIWILSCASPKEKRDRFYQRGMLLIEEKDYTKAKLEFKNTLQIDPNYDKGYYGLADCEFHLKNYKKAFSFANKTIELNPENLEANILLGRIYFLAKKWDESMEKVEFVLEKEPSNVEALLLQSSLSIVQEHYLQAEKILNNIIELEDNSTEAYIQLARLYTHQKDLKKAEDILKKGIARTDDQSALSIVLADIYIQDNNLEAAEKIYKENKNQLLLARFYLEIADFPEKGIEVLKKLIEEKPDIEEYRIFLARVYLKNSEEEEAEKILKTGIKEVTPGYKLRLTLAKFYKDNNQIDKTIELFKEAAAIDQDSVESIRISNQLAQIYLDQNTPDLALEVLDRVVEKNPMDIQARFLRGEIFLKDKKGLEAIGEFNYCREQEPNHAPTYDRLARAHLLNNEERLAIDYFKKAFTLDSTLSSSLDSLLEIYRKRGSVEDMITELKTFVDKNPNAVYAMGKLGDIYLRTNDFINAEKYYQQVLEADPNNHLAHYTLGLTYLKQNKNADAQRKFQRALAINPNFFSALEGLVNILIKEKRINKAIDLCTAHLQRSPDSLTHNIYNLMGRIYTIKKDNEKAKDSFNQAIMTQPGWIVPYSNMVEIFHKEGKFNKGLKYFNEIKKRYPDQSLPDFSRGILFLKNEEHTKAREVFKKVIEEHPGHPLASNNLAYIYAEYFPSEENLEKAQRLASQIVRDHPNQYNTLDTLAWIYCKQGLYNKGIEIYEKFNSSHMNNPVYAYHLGICYLKKGDKEKASHYLQKAADVSMNLYEVREAKRELERLTLHN